MFAIGDKQWPGISKLIEECGEVQQVAGKLIGTGGEIHHWDGTNLHERLTSELGDLLGAINFVVEFCGLDGDAIDARAQEKYIIFAGWHKSMPPIPKAPPK